eukprot:1183912-Prorocentrum_minimum.AAC.1
MLKIGFNMASYICGPGHGRRRPRHYRRGHREELCERAPERGEGEQEVLRRAAQNMPALPVSDWSVLRIYKPIVPWKGLWGVECTLAVIGTGGP